MSKPTPVFKGQVKGQKLYLNDPDAYKARLASLDGDKIEIVVRKCKSKRTLQQNSYLWGVVYKYISEACGHTEDELHSFFKALLLKEHIDIMGKRYTVVRSTTDLTTKEFTEYINKIKMWAAKELNCYVPDADQVEL